MSIAYYYPNSFTYSSNVLTINYDYQHLGDGGIFSVTGFPSTLTFSLTSNAGKSVTSTYSISLSSSTAYNLTFTFLKAPYYQLDAYGSTANSTLQYEINRIVRYASFGT